MTHTNPRPWRSLTWPLARYQVADDSMRPTLLPGDRLLVWRWSAPRPGDIVVLRDPADPRRHLVKRLVAAVGAAWDVRGDNPAPSRDSRHFGLVPPSLLVGRVIWRYLPAARRGRIPVNSLSSGRGPGVRGLR